MVTFAPIKLSNLSKVMANQVWGWDSNPGNTACIDCSLCMCACVPKKKKRKKMGL